MKKMERTSNTLRNRYTSGIILIASGALTLSGCGHNDNFTETTRSASPTHVPAEAQPSTPSNSPIKTGVRLVIDSLGGSGSTIVQVYPGVEATSEDKQANGTFNDGDIVQAECKTKGRIIHSDPSLGETDRTSNEWVRIEGTPGITQYATAVYIENPAELLNQLPKC